MADNIVNATEQVKKLTDEFDKHAKAIEASVNRLEALNREYAKVPSDFIRSQNEITKLEREQARTKQQLLKTTQEAERLKQQETRTASAQLRLQRQQEAAERSANRERQRTARATRTNISQFQSLNSRYQQQSRLLTSLRNRQRDFNIALQQGVKLTDAQEKEFRQLTTRVRTLDRQLKAVDNTAGIFNRNVGNYPRNFGLAAQAFKQLVGAFGVVEGLRLAFDFTKEAVQLSRQARGIRIAFNQLGADGVKAFDDVRRATRGALSDIDIQQSLVEFDNLGISLDTAGVAFEFLTLRASQTGQSIDQLRGDLVTGLGRGSARILDNLGLSFAELTRLTKEEGLTIQEAFGVIAQREISAAGDLIDQASNSQERLNAELENAQLAFGNLLTDQDFGVLGFLSDQLQLITVGLKNLRVAFATVKQGIDDFFTPIRELLSQIPFLNTAFEGTVTFLDRFFTVLRTPGINIFADGLRRAGAALSGLGAAFTEARKVAIDFLGTLAGVFEIDLSLNPAENARQIRSFLGNVANDFQLGGVQVATAFSDAYNAALQLDVPDPATGTTTPDAGGVGAGASGTQRALAGSLQALRDQISQLEKLRETTATTGLEYANFTGQIQKLEQELSILEQKYQGIGNTLETVGFDDPDFGLSEDDFVTPPIEPLEEYLRAQQQIVGNARLTADQLQEIFGGLFSTFSQMYNLDIAAFTRLFDEKNQTTADYAEAAGAAARFVLDATRESYEEELIANQERLQTILDDENASEEQKRIAEEQAAQEERRIKLKQAQEEKNAALIQIGIDTAVAVVKALASAPPPANFQLAAVVGALGAAQLAFVAAQPLPRFEKGTRNAPEGWAITQERRAEPITDKYGNLLSWGNSGGDQLTYLPEGAKVYPSRQAYFEENVNKASIMTTLASEKGDLSGNLLGSIFDRHLRGMKGEVKQGVKEGLKNFNSRININNKIDFGHQAWRNKKGY